MTRELGPVIASLMVAGRVGAAIATELGTTRATDQIDALSLLATNPCKYLVAPRLIPGTVMVPFLVLVSDIIGVFGGFLVSTYTLGFGAADYSGLTADFLRREDVLSGITKATAFGFVVTLMGCYQGYHARGSAAGVGAATTAAVVSASILILLIDAALTGILF